MANKCTKKGRNKKVCEAYRASGRREINKARKAARHIARVFA